MRIRQVLDNLVSNAIKFTPAGGTIRVTASAAVTHVVVEVIDTGVGIAADDMPRVFRTFEQTEAGRQAGGTGLGLAVSRELVELHGGSLDVASEPGRGTTFTLRLPIVAASMAPVAVTPAEITPPAQAQLWLLLVEDDEPSRRLLRYVLTRPGHQVAEAATVDDALVAARARRPDLVLTDIQIPGGGGSRLLAELQRDPDLAGVPVVATTAHAMVGDRERLLAQGFTSYLGKPLDTKTVAASVEEIARGGARPPADLATPERPCAGRALSGARVSGKAPPATRQGRACDRHAACDRAPPGGPHVDTGQEEQGHHRGHPHHPPAVRRQGADATAPRSPPSTSSRPARSPSTSPSASARACRAAYIVEIYGPESSGKTTLTLHAIAEAQKAGGVCAFIDAEHALDTSYARRLGRARPTSWCRSPLQRAGLEIVDTLCRTGAIDLIVIDSVAALVPRAEIEGDMGDAHMGLQARLMSQALRKLTAILSRTKTVCIFINQLRQKIGVVYGNPETTPGGQALKFYCSVRLDIRRRKPIKRGDETVGSEVKVKVVKNKLAPPFREAEFEILYGTGVNRLGELLDTGEKLGLVDKSGAWFAYEGEKLGQGRDKAMAHLDEHPALAAQLQVALMKQAKLVTAGAHGPGRNGAGHGDAAAVEEDA
ncbi:MAG: recombinase RecA [Kofleriaceae bacterium]